MNHGAPSSRRIRAEAASWVARLHGPDRDEGLEVGLKRWLAQDAEHARAFELATEVWQETGNLPLELPESALASLRDPAPERRHGPALAWAAASVAVMLGALLSYFYVERRHIFATEIGEQRSFTLADGTRVELNTQSRLVVRYDERARTVELEEGEAYFDVTTQREWPFIVMAAGREIIALGTAFTVRKDDKQVSVMLLEGRVAVTRSNGNRVHHATDDSERSKDADGVQLLQAGERLRIAPRAPPAVDLPVLDRATAWRRGQVIFDDTPLSEAVAELNRYSETRIELGSTDLGRIRVGGVFRAGDVSSFARAVAHANGLDLIDRGSEILLTRSKPSVR